MSTEIQFDAGVQRTNAIPIAKKGKSVRIKKPKKTASIASDMLKEIGTMEKTDNVGSNKYEARRNSKKNYGGY